MLVGTRKQEDDDLSPFYQLQKSQVLHEAGAFNEMPLEARKCCSVLTELLCLLSQGEVLGKEEATTLFFGVTKLFQSQDPQLRRLVYLVIKELNQNQEESFIVISSLEKDINGTVSLFRANSLRVHSKVIDSSMLEQRARLFRQCIVNPNEHIASSALCAGIRLFNENPDVIRRWVNEVREGVRSSKRMVPFHSLHLLYKIHSTDKRAIIRLVSTMINRAPESPLARCLLIRYVFSCLGMEPPKELLTFIKSEIKNYKHPMVMFEAARVLCHVKTATVSDLSLAIGVFQEFLNSPRPVQRFAAVRALSGIVHRLPILSPSCTVDLENLITDGNRNIATLAITTLLKTSSEYSIERLLSSISDFMTEIADELKVVLIDAIQRVCIKFPRKYEPLLQFLSMALREEGGYTYKNKIVDCMLILMDSLPRAQETGLDSLCEFIEDCEYPLLSVRILHLIGELGPVAVNPSRFIRFIFNRVLLELPSVRAAAVTCLTKFAVKQPHLKNDIEVLLKRSLTDEDDEVRDRATIYTQLLAHFTEVDEVQKQAFNSDDDEDEMDEDVAGYVDISATEDRQNNHPDGDGDEKEQTIVKTYIPPKDMVGVVIVPELPFNLADLEGALLKYIHTNDSARETGTTVDESELKVDPNTNADDDDGANAPAEAYATDFTVDTVQEYKEYVKYYGGSAPTIGGGGQGGADATSGGGGGGGGGSGGGLFPGSAIEVDANEEMYQELLAEKDSNLPEFGKELKCAAVEHLTEPESEYPVDVIKRVYPRYIVLQFIIQQLIQKQLIVDAYVEIDYDETEIANITCPLVKYGDTGMALCIVNRFDEDDEEEDDEDEEDDNNNGGGGSDPELQYILGKYDCILKFMVKDDNADAEYDEGYEDQYVLNNICFTHRDYVLRVSNEEQLSHLQFKKKWQEMEACKPIPRKGRLKYQNLQHAVTYVYESVGLTSIEDSHEVPDDVTQYLVNLSGFTVAEEPILMRCAFVMDSNDVTFKTAVRTPNMLLGKFCVRSF